MDKLDEVLKNHFSGRIQPPPEIKLAVAAQLNTAKNMKVSFVPRWIWSVVAYDFILSAAILSALWMLFGQSLIMYVAAVFVGLSLMSAVVVVTVTQLLQGRDLVTI